MDEKLTAQLQEWLNTPEEKRDLTKGSSFVTVGAMLCRRITRNVILGNNFERLPSRFYKQVAYQLGKFLPMRLQHQTHEDVVRMTAEVETITQEHKLDSKKTPRSKGKRPDHDQLPEEIQALYAENLSLMQQMRHNRAQLLVIVNGPKSSCPDGDVYPFLKELISLDGRYRANWQKYDEYELTPDGQ